MQTNYIRASIATAAWVFILSGCANVITSTPTLGNGGKQSGLVYSLPKGQMLLTASRLPVGPDTLAAAQTALAKALKDAQNDTATVATATASGDTAKISAAQAQQKTDQATLDAANATVKLAQANQNKWVETANLTVLPIAPDAQHRFVATLNHHASRDDNLKLSVVNGLLTTTTASSVDQTPNIIVTIADTVITFAAMASGLPVSTGTRAPTKTITERANCYYSLSEAFNPLDAGDILRVKTELQNNKANFSLISSAVPNDASSAAADAAKDKVATQGMTSNSGEIPGLVYRVATPVEVRIIPDANAMNDTSGCPLQNLPASQDIYTVIPDSRSEYLLSSEAGPFTTTNFNFGFSSGMLTDYNLQKPSEIAAVAGIPLRIANDIMQIPAQILQLKVNYNSAETALTNSQTTLLQAQIQRNATLANAKAAVVNAQTALMQATLGQPTAVANAQTALLQAQQALEQAIAGSK
jgi:hypothetical protein